MTDVKIKNGDVVADSTGKYVVVSEADALFQRAEICIGADRGYFIYDRELGSGVRNINPESEFAAERAELLINEAFAGLENTTAEVTEYGEVLKLIITVNGESRNTEVHLNGNV